MKKATLLASALILTSSALATNKTPTIYNDVFMSYFSADNINPLMKYITNHHNIEGQPAPLKGFILWEARGDMPYTSPLSLLAAANADINPNNPPMIMGYWSDWTVYSKDRMFNEPSYGIPGSIDAETTTGQLVTNKDLQDKLEGMNTFTYAFLEVQPNGSLFFFDPWSDLQSNDYTFCQSNTDICFYGMKTKPTDQKSFNSNVKMGNFSALSKLQHSNPNNPLGPLKKIFSVGGYGHDDSFENAMANPTAFATSANQILTQYKLDGIDLDYEAPNMTLAQSQQFKQLVDTLASTLSGKEIFVTILSNPAYIMGQKDDDTHGFAPGLLGDIAQKVTGINLMTYDFHGAFDYVAGGKGKTGFLTNINQYETDPFNIVNAVNAASSMGVPANKLSIGVPAYGRALQGIVKDNGGLNQAIAAAQIPRGDLDQHDCDQDITTINTKSCSGSFEYQFIENNMLNKGFTETVWSKYASTTAYAEKWVGPTPPPSSSYKLTIQNTGVLGITVSAKAADGKVFGPSDYIGPGGASKDYDGNTAISTKDISGDSNLTITWSIYDKVPHDCSQKLAAFTKDTTIGIAVTNDGVGTCTIPQTK